MAQTKINPTQIANEALTPGAYTSASITVNQQGIVTAVASTVPVLKRRTAIPFYPAGTTAETAPNLAQLWVLPFGTNGTASQWKLMSATLRTETPNAAATTVQFYFTAGGNSAFGAGTACLTTALSVTGATTYQAAVTSGFTGTLATTGLASGTLLTSQFSALGGTNVSLFTQWEEV